MIVARGWSELDASGRQGADVSCKQGIMECVCVSVSNEIYEVAKLNDRIYIRIKFLKQFLNLARSTCTSGET